jgi:hypothetical protein
MLYTSCYAYAHECVWTPYDIGIGTIMSMQIRYSKSHSKPARCNLFKLDKSNIEDFTSDFGRGD